MIDRIKSILRRHRYIGAAVIASVFAAVYWLSIASDQYVSSAHVIIQRTDRSDGQVTDLSTLLGGSGGNRGDQLLLRDHLLSVDMLKKIDPALNLRAHYSSTEHDMFSRLGSAKGSLEGFHKYFLSHVTVEFDDYAGVLTIKSQAFDPKTAHAITSAMVHEGERFMNTMAQGLVVDQVAFLQQQLVQMSARSTKARQAVLDYQNKHGVVSPRASAENIAGIVARLEARRAELEAQRSADQAYLVPGQATIVQVNQQIAAIEKQINVEQAKLTSASGSPLNKSVDEFQRLEQEASFANDIYKTGLVALEKGQIEATRTIKKVSVLQAPSMPESAVQPRRYYNTLVFILVALLLAGVLHLLAAIVRDHKD